MTGSIAQAIAEILDSTALGEVLGEVEFSDLVDDAVADLVTRFEHTEAALIAAV